jgi:hypothetical protein
MAIERAAAAELRDWLLEDRDQEVAPTGDALLRSLPQIGKEQLT